jgi:hypothetical protein
MEKHSDAVGEGPLARPAQDTLQVLWIGQDRMRVEEGDEVTIVRADLKKVYLLDMQQKTCSTVDLPLDLKKYLPAESAAMFEMMVSRMKATLTPTTEEKEIQGWSAKRYTLTMSMPSMQSTSVDPATGATAQSTAAGGGMTQEIWVAKEVVADRPGWQDLYASMLSLNPFLGSLAAEMRKLDGLPVLIETTRKLGSSEVKSREVVTSIEQQEPPAGLYDPPADFTEKPFDPMAEMPMGGRQARTR